MVSGEADTDSDEVLEKVSRIWRELINELRPDDGDGVDGIDVDADFVAAAGSSILAVVMLGRVYEEFGVDVSFRELLLDPSLRGLSRQIGVAARAEEAPRPLPLRD